MRVHALLCAVLLGAACGRGQTAPPTGTRAARSVVLITIDTLRADHVGAYGDAGASTPTLDALAREGARFDKAWAAAPITLTSHASLLSGRYPPGHRARHNGIEVDQSVPTLATALQSAGFATGAFVSAFPLDRRFGLPHGFDVYDDELPRGTDGRPLNERPGAETASRAIAWLLAHRTDRFFLWVHFFEPHAPYGDAASGRPALTRYDEEITTADREAGRVLAALGDAAGSTLVIAAADHGEAFGEHGEIGHSIFVYDTTLRVPLIMRGPGVPAGRVIADDVSLVDVAPTVVTLLGVTAMDTDGRSLAPALGGAALDARAIYSESFAPLFDFGWAGLRAVRDGTWKYIAAPRPELYDICRAIPRRPPTASPTIPSARRASRPRWPGGVRPNRACPRRPAPMQSTGFGRSGTSAAPRRPLAAPGPIRRTASRWPRAWLRSHPVKCGARRSSLPSRPSSRTIRRTRRPTCGSGLRSLNGTSAARPSPTSGRPSEPACHRRIQGWALPSAGARQGTSRAPPMP